MIGIEVTEPKERCEDPNCPFHGTLPVRGQILEGIVTSNKAERTITVERSFYKFIRKYERYEKRKSKIQRIKSINQFINHISKSSTRRWNF